MSNPYFWPFPQKNDTMYMSTIENKSTLEPKSARLSSFLEKDIEGAYSRQQIPAQVNKPSFNHSTQIQPPPEYWKSVKKVSDPLKHDDIEGSMPRAVEFKTNRVVNPINPRYKLPYAEPVDVEPPAKFLRNTLDITDIVKKKEHHKFMYSPKNQPVQGSSPSKLFKTVNAIPRLSVRDINNDGKFVSKRTQNPTDPLNPSYIWRDRTYRNMGLSFTKSTLQQEPKELNSGYGTIERSRPSELIPGKSFDQKARRSLDLTGIDGAKTNSANQRKYFFDRRKDFREYMKINDIEKTGASSLKKGISTRRNLNPLMPKYDYPS